MKKNEKGLLVGLDIGTTKIVCIVGDVGNEGNIEVVGVGVAPSHGLKRGVVVNIESTVQAVRQAVEEAELMAGCDIHSAYTGISGSHIRSMPSHGIVAIRDQEVRQDDIERVMDAAKALAIPADQKILHVLPNEFVVDNQDGVKQPIGMSGVRLEAKVHIVTAAVSAEENISKCVKRCQLNVDDVILQQLASSYAVLTEDEKELGVCLVDIGGGTTDIALFRDGSIHHTAVIPIAGDQVTNDIAVALRTPRRYAEEVKTKHACALMQLVRPEETVEIHGVGDRPPRKVERQLLVEVVGSRYEELFSLVYKEIQRTGYEDSMAAGIVLTGGSSRIEGAVELAEETFHMPVRCGAPHHNLSGLMDVVMNPQYATSVGLLMYGARHGSGAAGRGSSSGDDPGLMVGIKKWFRKHF
ncbi:MAG: cell division protein FtsA [Candidatus Porifericomitaceae bacterium WSBS_2022_MAG_OTU9]